MEPHGVQYETCLTQGQALLADLQIIAGGGEPLGGTVDFVLGAWVGNWRRYAGSVSEDLKSGGYLVESDAVSIDYLYADVVRAYDKAYKAVYGKNAPAISDSSPAKPKNDLMYVGGFVLVLLLVVILWR